MNDTLLIVLNIIVMAVLIGTIFLDAKETLIPLLLECVQD